jgi:molybdate transport system ATP-binding protein
MLAVDVDKRLGEFSLHAVFTAEGGATVLFGPSGSGKTSIINMVAGLLRPDRGRITLDDEVLFDAEARINLPPWKRHLGCVFQEGRLFPHFSPRPSPAWSNCSISAIC